MGRAGRPRLLQKDGYHRHDGYDRWHPITQSHGPELHTHIQKDTPNNLDIQNNQLAEQIHNIVANLEYAEYGRAILKELQSTIDTINRVKKLQQNKKEEKPNRPEQGVLGTNDTEKREPNTYGLP